jgi:hypothetical protein
MGQKLVSVVQPALEFSISHPWWSGVIMTIFVLAFVFVVAGALNRNSDYSAVENEKSD